MKSTNSSNHSNLLVFTYTRAEAIADGVLLDVSPLAKEVEALSDRAATLEADLTAQRERIDKDLRRTQRLASRLQADAQTYRSRVTDALAGFRGAAAMLENLPQELPTDDEPPVEAAPAD